MKANLVVVLLAAVFFFGRMARADEVAPALEGADLRVRAEVVLRGLVAAKPDPKLRGLYAAFDPNVSDPSVMAACDDDGDYVIVVSDAMLRLAAFLARLEANQLEEYADFLVRNQVSGKRLLPPAAGTFPNGVDAKNEERWTAIVAFLYARELGALRGGDLVCPNPTTTKERGDDTWTAAEQSVAAIGARALYPGKQLERDRDAIAELSSAGQDEAGALVLLQFFARFEGNRASASAIPTYLTLHPRSAWRAGVVKAAARPKPSGA